jgi:hypothetical protein
MYDIRSLLGYGVVLPPFEANRRQLSLCVARAEGTGVWVKGVGGCLALLCRTVEFFSAVRPAFLPFALLHQISPKMCGDFWTAQHMITFSVLNWGTLMQ